MHEPWSCTVRYIEKNGIITTFLPFKVASGCINPPGLPSRFQTWRFSSTASDAMMLSRTCRCTALVHIFCHVGRLTASIFAMVIDTILSHTPRHMFISDFFTSCFWPPRFKRQRMRDFMWRCLPLGNAKLKTNMDMKWDRKGKERKGKERKGKERQGKERKGKERKGKARQGKERKGKERTGEERRGKERKWNETNDRKLQKISEKKQTRNTM